jgi:uncharacterized phiE125 gp8 family phage protein
MRPIEIIMVTPPAMLPVTVEEFVDHARLNGLTVDRQPALIDRELAAATDRAQQYCRRSLMTQTLRAVYASSGSECVPSVLTLPRGPVQSVASIVSDGATIDPTTYVVIGDTVVLQYALYNPAGVDYVAGYGAAADDVPALIREGILQYATTLYENRNGGREEKYVSAAGRTLPAGVIDCWRPYQIEISG